MVDTAYTDSDLVHESQQVFYLLPYQPHYT